MMTEHILNNLRILKGKNPGDCYYDEYLKHYAREGDAFYDQYHFAIERVLKCKPKRILEIGVRTGLSICNMLSACINFDHIEYIDLVDIWADGYASPGIVRMNLKVMNVPEDLMQKITFHKESSVDLIPSIGRTYDYILVDGDHSKDGARTDLANVVPLCEQGGVIVFDDISPHGCNLQDVWDEFKAAHFHLFEFGENNNGKGVGWAIKQ